MRSLIMLPITKSVPRKASMLSFMGYLKGESELIMFDKRANLKCKFGNRHFWSVGYYITFSPYVNYLFEGWS